MKEKYPQRNKIIIDELTVEQVKHFNYLCCDITYAQGDGNSNIVM